MLGFPASTEFGKRIPKQKFYENLDVSPALHRMFVDQIKLVYWRNKLAASRLFWWVRSACSTWRSIKTIPENATRS